MRHGQLGGRELGSMLTSFKSSQEDGCWGGKIKEKAGSVAVFENIALYVVETARKISTANADWSAQWIRGLGKGVAALSCEVEPATAIAMIE
jgi:hypothetical protein